MKRLPVKTKGFYYNISNTNINQSKLRKMWNIFSDQEVLNGNIYNIIYFGEYYNEKTKTQSYFMGIELSVLTNNFKEFASRFYSNDFKHSGYESERVCYDFDYDDNEMVFQNELWLGNAEIISNVIYAKFRNKKTGNIFNMTFNYLLQQF